MTNVGATVLLLAATITMCGCASEGQRAQSKAASFKVPDFPSVTQYAEVDLSDEVVSELRDRWGVEVLGIRLGAANYMLDFRFHVIDAERALPLFDHSIKPYVQVDKSLIKLPVPMAAKVGAFRPTNRGKNIISNKNYYMVFGNPDRHVQKGDRVSVVIGDFKVAGLKVG